MRKDRRRAMPQLHDIDFGKTPFVAIWETTRACGLACRHCRAEAIPDPLPGQLTHEEGKIILGQLAEMGTPICVLSGGDPARRPDLCELVRYGTDLGMRMATIPAGTSLLTRELVADLKAAGLAQMALSLDGPTAAVHDEFRHTPGAFDKTVAGAGFARELDLPLQINTTFSGYNHTHLDAMGELVKELGVVFWEVFFLVPMGRGKELAQLNADQFEDFFRRLEEFSRNVDFIVKVTEGPHYRRYLMQQHSLRRQNRPVQPTQARRKGGLPSHMRRDFGPGGSIGLAPKGVNSGNGHLFISHCGEICPSGFLPVVCGNVRREPIKEVYQNHRTFQQLRDTSLLKGKCGVCEFRHVCGGSRARAYAMTGDWLAEEPFCAYQPRASNGQENNRVETV